MCRKYCNYYIKKVEEKEGMHLNILSHKLCKDYTHNINWSNIKNCGNTSFSQKEWTYCQCIDGWTEHLVVPSVEKPKIAQASSGFLLICSKFFYPDIFRHLVAILRGSWVPDKLLKLCYVLRACADYDPSHVASCHGMCQWRTQEFFWGGGGWGGGVNKFGWGKRAERTGMW
jgi:hypothetical protein